MTTLEFLEDFDLFADAPGAIPKIRELVLQLAIQGKMASQHVTDASAFSLLEAISVERREWSRKFRVPDVESSQDDSVHTFDLPSSWVWTKLGTIALQIQYGYTASADPDTTEVRMLRITDIQENRVNWPSVPGCQIEPTEAEKYLLRPNDILIARTGGTIGKSFLVPDAPIKSVFASYLIRVVPPLAVSARYLKLFLESPFYWTQLRRMSAGTGQPNVNGQALGRLELPLPPYTEQTRIVAKVDEVMALCDRLEAQQQERDAQQFALARASLAGFADVPTRDNLALLFHESFTVLPADLRKSILSLAIQGRLTTRHVLDEPVGTLLSKVAAERQKFKRTPSSDQQESQADLDIPYEIPSEWVSRRLDDLLIFGPTNGFSPKAVAYETPVRSLTLSATTSGRFKGEHSKYITVDVPANSELWLRDGDILVQRGNTIEYVGVAAIYRGESNSFVYPDLMMKLRLSSEIDPDFILIAMSAEPSRDFLRSRASGTSGTMPKINQTTLRSLPVPVPPLAEQRRIVAKVSQLMTLVDQLEEQMATSCAAGKKLMNALVTELSALR